MCQCVDRKVPAGFSRFLCLASGAGRSTRPLTTLRSRNWTCIEFLHLAGDSYGANHHWLAKHVEYSPKVIEHGKQKKNGMPSVGTGRPRPGKRARGCAAVECTRRGPSERNTPRYNDKAGLKKMLGATFAWKAGCPCAAVQTSSIIPRGTVQWMGNSDCQCRSTFRWLPQTSVEGRVNSRLRCGNDCERDRETGPGKSKTPRKNACLWYYCVCTNCTVGARCHIRLA